LAPLVDSAVRWPLRAGGVGAVAYLASPDAGFITGFSWNVDGGFAA
jgi:biotin transporter BioY